MSRKGFEILLMISTVASCIDSFKTYHKANFSLLIDFTCAAAKDELEKHPEMRTIAIVELENNFPFDFRGKIQKCLPDDVAKVEINPHSLAYNRSMIKLPKETMVIYVADKVDWYQSFYLKGKIFKANYPIVHHLSKHLIVSSDKTQIYENHPMFKELLNVAQIYEENGKVIAKSFDRTKNLTTFKGFENFSNLSQILFPDKAKNLNGQEMFAVYTNQTESRRYEDSDIPNNRWTHFLVDVVSDKLNATLNFTEIPKNTSNWTAYRWNQNEWIIKLINQDKLDFFLDYESTIMGRLQSYHHTEWCFVVPLPKLYSITELILFLPMDKSCWMWLGITIAVSMLVWRISESHWGFLFGSFALAMGQSQLVIRIKTNRLTMKILLQILIFAIFIFSNGYQSIVTSFMLEPETRTLLKTVDQIFDSDLNIFYSTYFHDIHKENPKYKKAVEDRRVVPFGRYESWPQHIVWMNLAYFQPCKIIKNWIEEEGDGRSHLGIYQVPEVADSLREELFTKPFHPYIDKFQDLMDRSFEAGLHQAWERFFYAIARSHNKNIKRQKEKTKEILDFGLIAPFFLIFAFGFASALFALLCEIFYHDFLAELKNYFKNKWKKILRREVGVREVRKRNHSREHASSD